MICISETVKSETTVDRVNDFCSIVDLPSMKVVGVRVDMNPVSNVDAVQVVRRYIKYGTCALLENTLGNKHPGQYIAAAINIKTGLDFTYIIGVEVEDTASLPEFLPPDTAFAILPAARYGKVVRDITKEYEVHSSTKQAICYLSSREFREKSGYCYDKSAFPFRVFGMDGEMTAAYEPVKIPQSKEERFESVDWQVILLPEIKVAGSIGEEGIDSMRHLFSFEHEINLKAIGCLNENQYYSFGCKDKDGNNADIFGWIVENFDNIPPRLHTAVMSGGLWVRFTQMQINNDDPSIFFEGAKELFFEKHPEFEEDYSTRGGLYIAQYEQGASFSFPIKKL